MNPNTRVYAAVQVNGVVTQWDQLELKYVPAKLANLIMTSPLTPQQFSSLELRISKRPIVWESKDGFDVGLTQYIRAATNDEPFDEQGDITHGEIAELMADPVWRHYSMLRIAPDGIDPTSAESITSEWQQRYGLTKFARLMSE